jgi:hypothetical protein
VVRNLAEGHRPVYALGEWAAPFDPAPLGLADDQAALLNDDRVGRYLAALFDADRASMLTRLVLGAVERFNIDCSQLHNDSTSVKLSGAYPDGDGHTRGGKPTAKVARGHSKDFRPDLKQLVWILTISADGAVPICYRAADGNTEDSTTHIDTWDKLVAMTGTAAFTYVADSKLATGKNMRHIDSHHLGAPEIVNQDRVLNVRILAGLINWTRRADHDHTTELNRRGRRLVGGSAAAEA